MNWCETCAYALWDYEEYSGTTQRQWFVCGCKKDLDENECDLMEDDDAELD